MNDVLAGTAAAVAGVTVAHPFDLIKTRLQTGVGGEVGALSMLRSAVASEGPLSLFKGLSSALYGYVPADIVLEMITNHGGIKSGELPPMHYATWNGS